MLRPFAGYCDEYKHFHRVQRPRKYRVTWFLCRFSSRKYSRIFESLIQLFSCIRIRSYALEISYILTLAIIPYKA